MNYTSIEQSKRLLELGLDAESADMSWMNNKYPECVPYDVTLKHANTKNFLYLPCWSVGALMKVFPTQCILGIIGFSFYCTHPNGHETDDYDEPIDACVELTEWLLKNGYIKS